MNERQYQTQIIHKLETYFPGCVVLKNDAGYRQGIPDLTVFYNDRWAALEIKLSVNARNQPNQTYYIQKMNDMSFAAFLYPENEEAVFNDLQSAFRPSGEACVSES